MACKKLEADDRADSSQKHGLASLSSGRLTIMDPRCSIIVRAVVPTGIVDALQSIGQMRSNVRRTSGPVSARITQASDWSVIDNFFDNRLPSRLLAASIGSAPSLQKHRNHWPWALGRNIYFFSPRLSCAVTAFNWPLPNNLKMAASNSFSWLA